MLTGIPFNLERGPWVAGGAARAWYEGHSVCKSDIDIFFRNPTQVEHARRALQLNYFQMVYKTPNAMTFKNDCVHVQLVKLNYFPTVEAIFHMFDITVACIATDTRSFVSSKAFRRDHATKTLHFQRYNNHALKRLLKYNAYGFQASDEQIQYIADNYHRWPISDDHYDIKF